MVYNISKKLKDHKGCGKAWAAIKDGEVVALRYMGDFAPEYTNVPAWVKAANKAYSLSNCQLKYISPTHLGRIKKAAIEAGHPEKWHPRGDHIQVSYIASRAQKKLRVAEEEEFAEYRNKCRQELVELGLVVSGECSCYEFIMDYEVMYG